MAGHHVYFTAKLIVPEVSLYECHEISANWTVVEIWYRDQVNYSPSYEVIDHLRENELRSDNVS